MYTKYLVINTNDSTSYYLNHSHSYLLLKFNPNWQHSVMQFQHIDLES